MEKFSLTLFKEGLKRTKIMEKGHWGPGAERHLYPQPFETVWRRKKLEERGIEQVLIGLAPAP